MTNIDRAAEIIEGFLPPLPGKLGTVQAEKTSRALHAAGLLAPDLPPVTHWAGMGVAGTDFPMASGRFASVNLQNSAEYLWVMFNPGSVTLIHSRGKRADAKGREWPDTRDMYLAPDAAREIAYTLLAAANNAEGKA